jgi:hypothetical protein
MKKPRPAVVTADERQLVEAMRTALLKRDARGALGLIARHRREHPKGQLAEERDSLEVQALVQEGRVDEARAAARLFTATYPNSVFSLPEF